MKCKMMRRIIFLFSLLSLSLLITACDPALEAYHRGNIAYQNGDDQTAFENYLYAAHDDIVPAQYAVGYQYYYGIGVKRDELKAILWFERAAPHSPRARYALALIDAHAPIDPWTYQLRK